MEDLAYHVNNLDVNHNKLKDLFTNETIFLNLFDNFTNSYQNMINNFVDLNKRICNYFEKNTFNFNRQIINKLHMFHEGITFFIQFLEERLLNQINTIFLDKEQEDKINKYATLIEYFMIVTMVIYYNYSSDLYLHQELFRMEEKPVK